MRPPSQILDLFLQQILPPIPFPFPLSSASASASAFAMAALLYHTFSFLSLFTYALSHLISSSRAPRSDFSARPYLPLPLPGPLRHLLLYLAIASLAAAIAYTSLLPSGTHLLVSLQHSAALLIFLLLALSLLLLPPSLSIPPAVNYLLASLSFLILSVSASNSAALYPVSDLQSRVAVISSRISLASAAFSLALSLHPHLFPAAFALSLTLAVQALWSLQSGLSLYVDTFIPEGCHRLLEVPSPATRCEIEDSRVRAAALIDLAFVMHAVFVAVVFTGVYMAVARGGGGAGAGRRQNGGVYEALPTVGSGSGIAGMEQVVQMKAIGKSSAQA